MRILLVEDNPDLGDALRGHLRLAGHATDWVFDLASAEAALRAVGYEAVLLDLGLPDGNGMDLLGAMRRAGDLRAVIILTAQDQVADRIRGLRLGADDYMVKPFDFDELTARLAAVTRRLHGTGSTARHFGDVTLDPERREATRDGQPVILTAREWALLEALLARRGAVVPRAALEEALYAFGAEVESNAIEVHVSRIRRKLGHELVQTQRGLGYRLCDES